MIIDPSGRGPTMKQLVIAGIALFVVVGVALWLLGLRYTGHFRSDIPVTARLTTTGDGLPKDSDVKFRGVLVGSVKDVKVTANGEVQDVGLEIKPQYIDSIPSTVTARVVPSNIFAVTSVELLDNGPGPSLHEGSIIQEDHSKGTVALQDTLTALRNVITAIDPIRLGRVLGTLADALDPSVRVPGSSIVRLDRWLTSVDAAIPDLGTYLGNFGTAFQALNQSAPELVDSLSQSVISGATIAAKRGQLANLLFDGSLTLDSTNNLFARNPNSGKEVVQGLDPMFNGLANDPEAIAQTVPALQTALNNLGTAFRWGPSNKVSLSIDLSFTPFQQYSAADCPRYGNMTGPSCATAPPTGSFGVFPPGLLPRRLDSAGPAPVSVPTIPPVSIPGLPPLPGIPAQGPPAHPGPAPAPAPKPFAGTPLEGLVPSIPGLQHPAAAKIEPGSYLGRDAVAAIVGGKPEFLQFVLLDNAVAGGSVQVRDTTPANDAPGESAAMQEGGN
ncbi:MCE family protein [Skermania sp. ID1734]|uniref:MlaD family protein n=1 Tax=Skermania sp. ID1734 TaxID=2597516 RepID=UPI00117CBE4A|nr:MCE family protein [Skermania sp. ID1734]TSE00299.1 MCE family protein [Skermania sp. ID1734]